MPVPKYLLDLEKELPHKFKKSNEYEFTSHPVNINLPSLEKKEIDAILREPIEAKYIHAEVLEDPVKIKQEKYEINKSRSLNLLRGKIYVGIDGSSKRIEREQLFFLFSRAVRYYYPIGYKPIKIGNKILKFNETISRAFFIVDENILREENIVRHMDYLEAIKNLDVIFFGIGDDRDESEDIRDINNRAMGYEARLRHLTELATISQFIEELDQISIPPEHVVITMDGPLMPRSVTAEEYQCVIRDVVKRGCLIISFVKRISYSKILRSIILKDDEIARIFSKVLFGSDDTRFIRRYYTDGILINKALSPDSRTFMFRYKLVGKMGTIEYDRVNKDYHPVAFYLKTRLNSIYRVEIPYCYYKKFDPEDIAKISFALIYENNGLDPRPIELADSIAEIKKEEELIFSRWLDSAFKNILGIELYKPYGVM